MVSVEEFWGEVMSVVAQPITIILVGLVLVCIYTVLTLPVAYRIDRLEGETKVKYTKWLLLPQKVISFVTVTIGLVVWLRLLLGHHWG